MNKFGIFTRARVCGLLLCVLAFMFFAVPIENGERQAYAEDNVVHIASANDMSAFMADFILSDDNYSGRTVELDADLDLTGLNFTPIGTYDKGFEGTFHGNGHTLTVNISVSGNKACGLFGYTGSNCVISDLTVAGNVQGVNSVGAFVGNSAGSLLLNCVNRASVIGSTNVGGLVGENTGAILGCVQLGEVTASSVFGGIAGVSSGSNGKIYYCVGLGSIVSQGTVFGGIVGKNSGSLKNNYAYVSCTGTVSSGYGSVVGSLDSVSNGVSDCYGIGNRIAVGTGSAKVPNTVTNVTSYQFLSKNITFPTVSTADVLKKAGISSLPYSVSFTTEEYEVGYGYLPCPDGLADENGFDGIYKDSFRMGLFADGEGTEEKPFVISTSEQWLLFSENASKNDYDGVYVSLQSSFNLKTVQSIGSAEYPFSGILNGNGNSLVYTISSSRDKTGLFSYLKDATVSNLVIGGYVFSSGNYAGFLAGYLQGNCELSDITVLAQTNNMQVHYSVKAQNYAGGIFGGTEENADVKITNCKNYATIYGNDFVGGLFGEVQGKITVNGGKNVGTITSEKGSSSVGGIGGSIQGTVGTVTNLQNTGAISAQKATAVGGIFGTVAGGTFTFLSSTAPVTGRYKVGGVIGESEGTVSLSGLAVLSTVSGASYLGGTVGFVSSGSLTAEKGYFVGTFARDTSIKTEYKTGVLATNADETTISASSDFYYNGDVYDGTQTNGVTEKSTVELCLKESDWDGTVWQALSCSPIGAHYPILVGADVTDTYNVSFFAGGDGTQENPFEVTNEGHFRAFGELYNDFGTVLTTYIDGIYDEEEDKKLYFCQKKDITLTRNYFTVDTFDGVYDGASYAIHSFVLKSSDNNACWITTLASGAQITGVIMDGTVEGGIVSGLIGENNGIVSRVLSLVDIQGNEKVGGIIVANKGTVSACMTNATLKGKEIGGIVCDNDGTVEGCSCGGVLSSEDSDAVIGGISSVNRGTIKSCSVNVYFVASSGYVGGLTGQNDKNESQIIACLINAFFDCEDGVQKGGIAGAFNQGAILTGSDSTYYNNEIADVMAYPGASDSFGKNNSGIRNSAVNGQIQHEMLKGSNGYNANYDAYYTFIPEEIGAWYDETSSATVQKYARKNSEIPLWGYNRLSDFERGTENNPYQISTASELVNLSNIAVYNNYTDKYFVITDDIDMSQYAKQFAPIGKYQSVNNNYAFNGTLDGQYHSLQKLEIEKDEQYVGLFGYTGSSFVLKNLIIDSTCKINGKKNVASFVGYFQGKIQNCRSSAQVTATEEGAGGLVGSLAVSGSAITDSLFDGTLSDTAYGLVGEELGSMTLVTTNSWFLTKDTSFSTDTVYGNAVVEYENTEWEIDIIREDGKAGYAFSFSKTGDSTVFQPFLGETKVTEGTSYYLKGTSQDLVAVHYCQKVTLISTADKLTFTVSDSKTDYFYEGQTVSFRLAWKENGYYLQDKVSFDGGTEQTFGTEYDSTLTQAGTGSDDMVISFTMFTVSTDTLQVNLFAEEIGSKFDYTGITEAEYTGEGLTVEEDKLTVDGFDFSVTYYKSGSAVSSMHDVGTYSVRIGFSWSGKTVLIGRTEISFEVTKKALSLTGTISGSDIGKKTYDEKTTLQKTLSLSYISGLVESDKDDACVQATVTWYTKDSEIYTATANAGENLYFTVNTFVLSGSAGGNYTLSDATYYEGGVISPLVVAVLTEGATEVSEKKYVYTEEYSAKKPTAPTATPAKVTWDYEKVDESYQAVSSWDGIYNVGLYRVTPTLTDENNYVFATSDCSYYIQVTPKTITDDLMTYRGQDGLVYSGQKLDAQVSATYKGVDGKDNKALLTFFVKTDETENTYVIGENGTRFVSANGDEETRYKKSEVLGAGTYYMSAEENAGENYHLACGIVSFTVAKATVTSEQFTFTVDGKEEKTSFAFGDYGEIGWSADFGLYGYQKYEVKFVSRAGSHGEVVAVKEGEVWNICAQSYGEDICFRLIASGSDNYQDVTSSTLYSVTVQPKTIYVGLEKPQQVYGSEISLKLSYYQSKEPLLKFVGIIAGLKEPVVSLGDIVPSDVGKYSLYFSGGNSDGFVFEAITTELEIVPKQVYVSVPSGLLNSKQYGEKDPTIQYLVFEDEDCKNELTLPDGSLSGALSRQKGENSGSYEIYKGTMESAKNDNYTVTYVDGGGRFTIRQRDIRLEVMQGQNKAYGEGDSPFVLAIPEGSGYSMAEGESTSLFTTVSNGKVMVKISRQEGEEVGYYAYTVSVDYDYAGESNYNIIDAVAVDRFYIGKATPVIRYTLSETVYYGDTASVLSTAEAKALSGSTKVDGTFSWDNTVVESMEQTVFTLNFTPQKADCYYSTSLRVAVRPEKRVLVPLIGGSTRFVYDGKNHDDALSLTLDNLVNGNNRYTLEKTTEGDCKNVTAEGFTVRYRLTSDYYSMEEKAVSCVITPALLTVTMEDLVVSDGEEINITILYSGFVNKESERVLTKKATVLSVPTAPGIYMLSPAGAQAQNYSFSYQSGVLCINQTILEGDGATIEGEFAPTDELTLTQIKSGTAGFQDMSDSLDKTLGGNLFLPLSSELTAYYALSCGSELTEENYRYSLTLSEALQEKDIVYVRTSGGELLQLSDYEVSGNGTVISFETEGITSLAVYSPKETTDLIIGYIPLAACVLGVLMVIAIITAISYFKKHKRKKDVYRAVRGTYYDFPHRKK